VPGYFPGPSALSTSPAAPKTAERERRSPLRRTIARVRRGQNEAAGGVSPNAGSGTAFPSPRSVRVDGQNVAANGGSVRLARGSMWGRYAVGKFLGGFARETDSCGILG
jgi:hypothetical protein